MRRVPQEYATIQAAFNAVQDGDMVLVEPGVYAEELTAPARTFVLKGNTIPDTGDYPRPVVDPSTLSNPRERKCMTLPAGSHPVIEDFAFRNGPEMYPNPGGLGGILNYSADPVFRRCLWDPTKGGVSSHDSDPYLVECRFYKVDYMAVNGNRLRAVDCNISGNHGEMVHGNSGTELLRCEIRNDSAGVNLVVLWGDSISVRDCIIGPSRSNISSPVLSSRFQGVIENCLFQDCQQAQVVNMDFDPEGDTSFVRGNHFIGNNMSQMFVRCYGGGYPCFAAVIENNVFEDFSYYYDGAALDLRNDAIVRWNRFSHIRPGHGAAVIAYGPFTELRYNFFDSTGYAAAISGSQSLDALYNWWGDASGPFNRQRNPGGRGDSVGNGVHFDPWLADTTDLRSIDRSSPVPRQFSLEAFPNPFNAAVRLHLSLSEPRIVELQLFDLLGRRVRSITVGPVHYEKDVMMDTGTLPSGIYLMRMRDTVRNISLAQTKLVQIK